MINNARKIPRASLFLVTLPFRKTNRALTPMFLNPKEDRSDLIARFESMLKEGSAVFFDSSAWEDIIDYYLRNLQYEKAGIAASMALNTYSTSSSLSLACCICSRSILRRGIGDPDQHSGRSVLRCNNA